MASIVIMTGSRHTDFCLQGVSCIYCLPVAFICICLLCLIFSLTSTLVLVCRHEHAEWQMVLEGRRAMASPRAWVRAEACSPCLCLPGCTGPSPTKTSSSGFKLSSQLNWTLNASFYSALSNIHLTTAPAFNIRQGSCLLSARCIQ